MNKKSLYDLYVRLCRAFGGVAHSCVMARRSVVFPEPEGPQIR
mgnify:CR=1 FL=1